MNSNTPNPISHFKIFSLLLSAFLFFSTQLQAQGDLLIYPKRVVFDGARRSQELSLVNNGSDTARYVISVVQIRMKEDGSFENINTPDPGQNFADKNFRFFPRNVVLGPKEAQTVKLQLTQYSQLPAGEYRSHLYFRAEAEKKPLGTDTSNARSGSIAVRIVPVFGLSIPVIIRAGESTTEIGLSKVKFNLERDSMPVLQMNLNRSGNMSVYGDVTVDYVAPNGKEVRVANINGLAVYAPNTTRSIRLPLDRTKGIDYRNGGLHVVYTDRSGKVEKVAQEHVYMGKSF